MIDDVDCLSVLMERYAMGEDAVFGLLYQLIAPRLHRFCQRLVALRSEADDLFQETLLKLHRARTTYLRGGSVLHWLFAIARSVYLDRLRYRRRRPEDVGSTGDVAESDYLSADERYSPEAQAHARDLSQVVTDELRRMSEKNRIAYVLVREEGLSIKEAAGLLGTTADAVKQRVHRACEQLRAAVNAAGWRIDDVAARTNDGLAG